MGYFLDRVSEELGLQYGGLGARGLRWWSL